jgi:hypothetical protein
MLAEYLQRMIWFHSPAHVYLTRLGDTKLFTTTASHPQNSATTLGAVRCSNYTPVSPLLC